MNRVDGLLKVEKQRNGEHEPTYGLQFDTRSLQFKKTNASRIKHYA